MKPFALLALGAALVLTACQQEAAKPADPSPDAKPGLTLSDGRLTAPAVPGNPGAAYFTLQNGGSAAATLAAVSVEGAEKSEMHETSGGSMSPLAKLEIKPGETVKFGAGGKHVMVFGLKPDIAPGGTVEITLTFADGDKLSAPLTVEGPGGGMRAMDHGDGH